MKKLLSLLIALVLVVSSGTMVKATDYENSWAKNEISYMKEKGILVGYPDGTFKPINNMAKSEFYSVINGLMGFTEKEEVNFSDVSSNDWYYEIVQKGVKAGYIVLEDTLNADMNITRGEVARIISAVFGIEENEEAAKAFIDYANIPEALRGIIGGLKSKGLVAGFPDRSFGANAEITRAEVVKMLNNISGEIINQEDIVSKDAKDNMVVNTAGVVLKDMTIEGNLYLTEGIGEGDIILDNVTVKGLVSIKGGGANSVKINNSKINKIVVDKSNKLIRLVLENTIVEEVKTLNQVKLELTKGTEINLVTLDGKVEVSVEKGASIITLDAISKEITIESKGTIKSIVAKEELKVNGEIVKPNLEFKVEEGKIIEVKPETSIKEPSKEVKSESSIVSKYSSQLSSLQSSIEGDLSHLVSQAQAEINAGGSLKAVYNKYLPMANKLESSADGSVSSIISSMEAELIENGYDTSASTTLYNDYSKAKSDFSIDITLP